MDFTNEINTLESEKLRLEEMLKRNNDRLQLLKEASTEPSSDGYRRFFKLKGYSLLYTGGERLNHERFIFNCTLVSQYQNFRYYKSQIMPTVKIRPKFERCRSVMGCVGELWNYDRFYIHEGYHSYLTEEMAKGRMYCAEIGIFEIPVGATVYINYAYREVVSTDIKYLGLLEEI